MSISLNSRGRGRTGLKAVHGADGRNDRSKSRSSSLSDPDDVTRYHFEDVDQNPMLMAPVDRSLRHNGEYDSAESELASRPAADRRYNPAHFSGVPRLGEGNENRHTDSESHYLEVRAPPADKPRQGGAGTFPEPRGQLKASDTNDRSLRRGGNPALDGATSWMIHGKTHEQVQKMVKNKGFRYIVGARRSKK